MDMGVGGHKQLAFANHVYYFLHISNPGRWNKVVEVLTPSIPDHASLHKAIDEIRFRDSREEPRRKKTPTENTVPRLRGLEDAIEQMPLPTEAGSAAPPSSSSVPPSSSSSFAPFFFTTMLPKLQEWAISLPSLFPPHQQGLKMLKSGEAGEVEVSYLQCRSLLALNFFCGLNPANGDPDFYRIYTGLDYGSRPVGIARIQCLLGYFLAVRSMEEEGNQGKLVFRRRVAYQNEVTLPDWSRCDEVPIPSGQLSISTDVRIEDAATEAHMNFANKDLHIGCVVASATQEEVLFSIRPELFVGMLVVGDTMAKNEAIIISGARKFSCYTGYLNTFRYAGPRESIETNPPDIICIDAVVARGKNQFQSESVCRDLDKCYLGFLPAQEDGDDDASKERKPMSKKSIDGVDEADTSEAGNDAAYVEGGGAGLSGQRRSVSTGNWGCGAFGGDVALKMVEQCMAAAAAGVDLQYSTFNNEDLKLRLSFLHTLMQGLSVADVYALLEKWAEMGCVWTPPESNGHGGGSGGGGGGSTAAANKEKHADAPLLRLAKSKGETYVAAYNAWNEAMLAEEEGHRNEAVMQYRKAFRAWPELDSPMNDHRIPRLLEEEVDEVMKAAGSVAEGEGGGGGSGGEFAPYLTGDFQHMKRLATELPASNFEAYLRHALLELKSRKEGMHR